MRQCNALLLLPKDVTPFRVSPGNIFFLFRISKIHKSCPRSFRLAIRLLLNKVLLTEGTELSTLRLSL